MALLVQDIFGGMWDGGGDCWGFGIGNSCCESAFVYGLQHYRGLSAEYRVRIAYEVQSTRIV